MGRRVDTRRIGRVVEEHAADVARNVAALVVLRPVGVVRIVPCVRHLDPARHRLARGADVVHGGIEQGRLIVQEVALNRPVSDIGIREDRDEDVSNRPATLIGDPIVHTHEVALPWRRPSVARLAHPDAQRDVLGIDLSDGGEIVAVFTREHLLPDRRVVLVAEPVAVVVETVQKVLVDEPIVVVVRIQAGRDDDDFRPEFPHRPRVCRRPDPGDQGRKSPVGVSSGENSTE